MLQDRGERTRAILKKNYAGFAAVVAAGMLAVGCSGSGGELGGGTPPVTESGITLLNPEPYILTGEPGGPFTPETKAYSVLNSGDDAIDWDISTTGEWLVVIGSTSGTLAPGEMGELVLGYDPAVADSYAVGAYGAELTVRDLTNGEDYRESATLIVLNPDGSLTVDPVVRLDFGGEPGGPFTPDEHVYTLTNQGASSIDWTASSDQPWLLLSSTSGTIGAESSVQLTVTLDEAAAGALPVGDYLAEVSFTNATNGSGDTTRQVALGIESGPQGMLEVTPLEDFLTTGPEGGPFTPPNKTYTLSNMGQAPLDWSVGVSGSWLSVSGPTQGTLAAGGSTAVVVEVDSSANSLTVGAHGGSIAFANLTDGNGDTTLGARLTVTSSDGWTQLTPSVDTQIVYVSSSTGDDANDGLSEQTPKRTIQAGLDLLSDGFPDWLLLKKGDVFTEVPPNGVRWTNSGRSETEPSVFSSYGPPGAPRPLIQTGGTYGLRLTGQPTPRLYHVAVVGIEFSAYPRDGVTQPQGIMVNRPTTDLLIEDCKVEGFQNGVTILPIDGRHSDIRLRRTVVVDSYSLSGSHAQGMFADHTDGLLIEENVFDHSGWTENDPNAHPPNQFKHGMYLATDSTGVVVVGNIVTNSSGAGVQLRPGGVFHDNILARSPVGVLLGGGHNPIPEGVTVDVRGNVILDGTNHDDNSTARFGFYSRNIVSGTVRDNIIANAETGLDNRAITLNPALDLETDALYGMENAIFEDNIAYNWGGPCLFVGSFENTTFSNVTIRNNVFQNLVDNHPLIRHVDSETLPEVNVSGNRNHSELAQSNHWANVSGLPHSLASYMSMVGDTTSTAEQVSYVDPNRTIASYNASLGGAPTTDAFIAEALQQSKDYWRPEYTAQAVNAYIRAGFVEAGN